VLGRWGGEQGGSTVVIGHTVHTGGGYLEHLDRFRPGQYIRLVGRVWTVRWNHPVDKGVVADHSARLFRQTGHARLVLVTCTDWDGVEFLSNQVLVALPA
jgi:sortase (surface protein transpeptidase)